jgi:hypothetical protein
MVVRHVTQWMHVFHGVPASECVWQEYNTSARGESIGGVIARLKEIDPVITDEIHQTVPHRRDAE